MSEKKCFMNAQRPCDLTCKAAFEVDDPVDNVDCYFIWLAYHFGEGFYEIKRALEGVPGGGPGGPGGPGGQGGPGGLEPPGGPGTGSGPGLGTTGPKDPKGFPKN